MSQSLMTDAEQQKAILNGGSYDPCHGKHRSQTGILRMSHLKDCSYP